MDVDDDLNALLAGDGDDIDCILKDAGLTPGSDEIDLDALLADIDAEDNGSRITLTSFHEAAATPSTPAVISAPGEAEIVQARGKLSHALAAAAAPVGASDASSANAAAVLSKSERKPSDMNEDDMLQVRLNSHYPTTDTASPCHPPCHATSRLPVLLRIPYFPTRPFLMKATTTTIIRLLQPPPPTLSLTSVRCWPMTLVRAVRAPPVSCELPAFGMRKQTTKRRYVSRATLAWSALCEQVLSVTNRAAAQVSFSSPTSLLSPRK